MSRPANSEMVDGYVDGRDLESPDPSANRSYSYRHGFMVGRTEKQGQRLGSFDQVSRMADAAMDKDDGILGSAP
jgi:hypothetical protein